MRTRTVTVMVIDLIGSTRAIAAVPRTRMSEMMTDSARPIRTLVEGVGGTVVKFTGDGYLITFDSATDALQCATDIVALFTSQPVLPVGTPSTGCRIAMHTCDVVPFEQDVLGEGVVIAARMEKFVPPNSVYVTATVRDVAKHGEFDFVRVEDLVLDGLPRPVAAYRLMTETYRGVERDVVLTVTDLVGMSRLAAELPLYLLNLTLQKWVGLHRDTLEATRGRLRAVAGDNILSTHPNADDSVDFLIRLESRIGSVNDNLGTPSGLAFSSFTTCGDLLVPDFGVAGPLVNDAVRKLQMIRPNERVVSAAVADRLTRNRELLSAVPADERAGLLGCFELSSRGSDPAADGLTTRPDPSADGGDEQGRDEEIAEVE